MSLTPDDLAAIEKLVQFSEERMKKEIVVSATDVKAQLTAEIRSVGADVARLNATVLSHVQNQAPWQHDNTV